MKKQKLTSIILSAAIAGTTLAVPTLASAEVVDANMVGKYMQFGNYYGNPVNYKIAGVRDVDGDGTNELFLYSQKIISEKSWNQSGTADWKKATLRTWLNSAEEVVSYEEGNIPEYANQKGFLAHFTDAERQLIVPETHKTLIHAKNITAEDCYGGTGGIGWVDKWPGVYTTPKESGAWDEAAYVITTDSVFIPSIEDMYLYSMELSTSMNQTDATLINAAGESVPSGTQHVWVRDGHDLTKPRQWYPHNSISVAEMSNLCGIRPCFYIKSGLEIVSGTGTATDPFRILAEDAITEIGLSTADGPADWEDGEVNVSVAFSQKATEQEITILAARYEVVDGKEVLVDVTFEKADMAPNSGASMVVTIENAEASYMKVMAFDADGKSLCSAKTFGTVMQYEAPEKTSGAGNFYAEKKVEEKHIFVNGGEKNRNYAKVTVLVYQGDEMESILYANQKMVSDGNFAFDFVADKAFGENEGVGGWYNIVVSSDYSDEIITLPLGIASEALYEQILDYINDEDAETAEKIFSQDEEYLLEYTALEGKGLYLEELAIEGAPEKITELLIANCPEGGYTQGNFVDAFNQAISCVYFDAAETEDKYLILEDEKYSAYLISTDLTETKTYQIVKESDDSDLLFKNITGAELDEKLEEALILTAIKVSENANQVMSVITENQDTIGIRFTSTYEALSTTNLKKLYDKLVGKTYSDMAAIEAAFDAALEAVKPKKSSGGGGGGGSSSSSGGAYAPIAAGNIVTQTETKPAPEAVTFADVETLTWGKTEIKTLTQQGIISGLSENSFGPDEKITREQFARLIDVAFKPANNGNISGFADVEESAWYAPSVRALLKAGYISGLSETEFGVGKNITRQDLAVILYRVIKNKLSQPQELTFTDNDAIAEYAKEAVSALSASGIINAYSDGSFGAAKEVTRREAAVMLYQALKLAE